MDETLGVKIKVSSEAAEKSIEHLDDALEKSNFSATKLAGAMLGVRSAYALVRKAVSSYLSVNTELNDKFNNLWVGVGSMLAPALETVAKILEKAVLYANTFIYAITQVDLLAKGMESAASSTEKMRRSLMKFDEINAMQSTSTSSGWTGSTLANEVLNYINVIEAAVATAMIPLGLMLMLWGQPLVGAALIAVGAISAYNINTAGFKAEYDTIPEEIRQSLEKITAVCAVSMVALGVIALFFGAIPLGLGLLVGGLASAYAYTSITNPTDIESSLTTSLGNVGRSGEDNFAKIETAVSKVKDGISNVLTKLGLLDGSKASFTIEYDVVGPTSSGGGSSSGGRTYAITDSRLNSKASTIPEWFSNLFKADGGFVSAGQMFVARESGPELVGTIGGHTAVANNQQIIEGIKQGVKEALAQSNQNIVLNVDGKSLFDIVVQRNNAQVKSTGGSPLLL